MTETPPERVMRKDRERERMEKNEGLRQHTKKRTSDSGGGEEKVKRRK